MRDEHVHHPGNGVTLCRTCHSWVHGNPSQARAVGLIVSRHETDPCSIPWRGITGWWQPDCTGGLAPTDGIPERYAGNGG